MALDDSPLSGCARSPPRAVGVSFENLTFLDQGTVHVVYGSAGGLTAEGNQFWNQDSPGVLGEGFSNDRFGATLS